MKNRLSHRNNDLFKSIMSELDAVPPYDLDMENKTMEMIDVEIDQSLIIQKYKKWSRLGFSISIVLVCMLLVFSFRSMLNTVDLKAHEVEIQHYIPSFFAFIGLVLIFIQLQIRKQSYSMKKL